MRGSMTGPGAPPKNSPESWAASVKSSLRPVAFLTSRVADRSKIDPACSTATMASAAALIASDTRFSSSMKSGMVVSPRKALYIQSALVEGAAEADSQMTTAAVAMNR